MTNYELHFGPNDPYIYFGPASEFTSEKRICKDLCVPQRKTLRLSARNKKEDLLLIFRLISGVDSHHKSNFLLEKTQ